MVRVQDVAQYILNKRGPMTTWKLQKLVYYAQAWSLVWDEERLFNEKIEAWANGPVVRALYDLHSGQYTISELPVGDFGKLTPTQRETVDAVLEYYGAKNGQWLADLTHIEDPWKNARRGVQDGARSNVEITPEAMAEYYGGLDADSPDC